MQSEVINHNPHILLYVDATEAITERGQVSLIGMEFARTFAFIRDDVALPPRVRDLVTAAFGVREASLPRLGYQARSVELAWLNVQAGAIAGTHAEPMQLLCQLVWHHPIRNRRISRLARGLALGDSAILQDLLPEVAMAGSTARRTVVLTDSVEHAIEIVDSLAGWPLVVGGVVSVDGLNRRQQRVLATRRGNYDGQTAVVTTAGLESLDLNCVDAVVWAGAGPRPAPLPVHGLDCAVGTQHGLLLVDCRDRHHRVLRRWSRERLLGCCTQGWFPVGMHPIVGRIKNFLEQRPDEVCL